jgi:protein-tyrosine phosphatase
VPPPADLDAASAGGSSELLLFVCVANVCRSPAMHFLTAQGLHEHGVGTTWELASAGTSVTGRQQMCSASASYVADLPGGAEFARTHRSQPLDQGLVERAGLILVASQRERSAVVRLAPAARARTFTMIEAALLAEKAASRAPRPSPGTPGTDAREPGELPSLDSLVSAMNLSRGLINPGDPSLPKRGLLSRQRGISPFDIADVHGGVRQRHAPALAEVSWASTRIAEGLAAMTGGSRA